MFDKDYFSLESDQSIVFLSKDMQFPPELKGLNGYTYIP